MVTRDPAIEAAQRAERASKWWDSGNQTAWDSDYAEAAAREALTPIRKLHKPEPCGCHGGTCPGRRAALQRVPGRLAVPDRPALLHDGGTEP